MHPEHLKDLRKSGLTDETIAKLGIYSEDRPEEIDRLLNRSVGFTAQNQLGSCLVIPYPGFDYARIRPLWPRRVGELEVVRDVHGEVDASKDNRKVVKYESPVNCGLRIYDGRAVYPGSPNYKRVYVVEGEKKAALMNQEGLPTFGLPGVDGGHSIVEKAEAEDRCEEDPYFLQYPIRGCAEKGMEICVVFDYPDMDGANRNVIRAAVRTLKMIQKASGVPMLSYITTEGGQKMGVDDYYVSLGADPKKQAKFAEEIEDCTRPAPPNEWVTWLDEALDCESWDAPSARLEIKRAALIAGAWFETSKPLKAWIKKVVSKIPSKFHISDHDLESWAKITSPRKSNDDDPRTFIDNWAGSHRVTYNYGTQLITADGKETDSGLLFSKMALDTPIRNSELRHAFDLWLDEQDRLALEAARKQLVYAASAVDVCSLWVEAVTGDTDPVDIAVIQHWIWQVRRKLFGLPVEHHLMPIFTGKTDSGKSTAITRLLGPIKDLSTFRDADILQDERQSAVLARYFVIFFDEMPKVVSTNSECIKNRITSETVSWRKLGTNNHVTRNNVASFIGAANEDVASLFYDPTGMRRFYEVHALPKIDWETVNRLDYLAMWKAVDQTQPSPLLPHLAEVKARQAGLRAMDPVEEFVAYSCQRVGWNSAKSIYQHYLSVCNPRHQKPYGEYKFYRVLKRHLSEDGRDWKKSNGNILYNLTPVSQTQNSWGDTGMAEGEFTGTLPSNCLPKETAQILGEFVVWGG